MLQLNVDERPALSGVGLGGYWAERIVAFVRYYPSGGFNPGLFPMKTWRGKSIARERICGHRYKVRDQLSRKIAIVV